MLALILNRLVFINSRIQNDFVKSWRFAGLGYFEELGNQRLRSQMPAVYLDFIYPDNDCCDCSCHYWPAFCTRELLGGCKSIEEGCQGLKRRLN